MHVTMTALVKTVTDLKQLRKAAELLSNASKMTSNIGDLKALHVLANDASDAMAAFMKVIDLPDATGGHEPVANLAAEELAAGPGPGE